MPRKSPPKRNEKPQFERFIEAVKQIGANNTDDGLLETIRKIAGSKAATKPLHDSDEPAKDSHKSK